MPCEKVGNAMVCSSRKRTGGARRSGYLTKAQSDAAKGLLRIVPEIGREYIVSKYWTGTFKGRVLEVSPMGRTIHFLVTDAMRPGPLIEEKCSFPECVSEDGHDGDHQFSEFRNGMELDVLYAAVDLRPAVTGQLAHEKGDCVTTPPPFASIPNLSSGACVSIATGKSGKQTRRRTRLCRRSLHVWRLRSRHE